ncbi:Gfo/Idh/MocA family protein [Natronococcus jeotgali]|uniref:Oxidoreductase domain-containing protein n=1 Tax=Natronococcus jeotgali DSM 18795 TaxID=1227498 RepID=L9XWD8_9EURY|nr:Gfo/Idh/MocA family oxidoreductase [Natronococcus jeotgali]ELY66060.1 oxidoreductase domain-containing protein [Natronococcus jeotgali DSM 18795]
MADERRLAVGVIGVGAMGRHHARVYEEVEGAALEGVFDVDAERANAVAARHGTAAVGLEPLLDRVDAVSVAVPTAHHLEVVRTCLEAGVPTLVEKPVVGDLADGRALRRAVEAAGVPVQVGHVERFNPAVEALEGILEGLSIVDVTARRLGPPPGRPIADGAVVDLMIHDIDVVLALLEDDPVDVTGRGVAGDRHASALLEFPDAVASLTASRLTQRKVRSLEVTAEECLVAVDYLEQSIEIHRRSVPEYVRREEGVRFRRESLVERVRVSDDEPLRRELASFLETVRTGSTPEVTVEDGLAALEVARRIEGAGRDDRPTADLEASRE